VRPRARACLVLLYGACWQSITVSFTPQHSRQREEEDWLSACMVPWLRLPSSLLPFVQCSASVPPRPAHAPPGPCSWTALAPAVPAVPRSTARPPPPRPAAAPYSVHADAQGCLSESLSL
jgi:hypothetical protein